MKFPALDACSLSHMAGTLTRPRLSKYLHASKNNLQQALRLYVFNTKISAAVMTDLHYIEVGLRNKFDQALPPGKVIAELTFGFWLQLTDSKLEHKLWVPCLHKAFAPRKAPKRATFNQQLEKLRQLRNRVAHHEPIFHLDLLDAHKRIFEVGNLLCPTTANVMRKTSTVRREVMSLTKYCQRRGL